MFSTNIFSSILVGSNAAEPIEMEGLHDRLLEGRKSTWGSGDPTSKKTKCGKIFELSIISSINCCIDVSLQF